MENSTKRVVTAENLGADFRGVGSKIVVDSCTGGAGVPTSMPPEPDKIWQWYNTTTSRMTHVWIPRDTSWSPCPIECEGCEVLRNEVAELRAIIENMGSITTPITTPSPPTCRHEFSTWDLSNGSGDGRINGAGGSVVISLTPRDGAVVDWKGNNSAQRDIPRSQSHSPSVAGAPTFRTSLTLVANSSVLITLTPSFPLVDPELYLENLGQVEWNGSQNGITSIRLFFENSTSLERLSGGDGFIVENKNVWRNLSGQAQNLGRSTDDSSGEAAGWVKIEGTFGPSSPIRIIASGNSTSRLSDAFALTLPFIVCT